MGVAALSHHEITEQAHPKSVHTAPDVLVLLKQIVDIDTGWDEPSANTLLKSQNCGVVLRHRDQSHLIFDLLDNRNPALRINYQKVSWLKDGQEVAMKWGLGRSAWLHTGM